jgi:glycolate oxidase FAD binding subunit
VKNVAGYDLGKLFCGSKGRLGLIARASLRLHPRPEAERTLVVAVDTAEEAERLHQLLHRSTLVPSAVDLIWQGPGSRLAVLFEGSARAVDVQLGEARELLGGDEADPAIWDESRARQARFEGRISFPPRGLAQTLRLYPEAVVRPSAGSGYVPGQVPEGLEAGARRLAERIREAFDPQGTLA